MATHVTDTTTRHSLARNARAGLAGRDEVVRWAAVAVAVAVMLLSSVAVVATLSRGNPLDGLNSGLLVSHHRFGDVLDVFQRNLLVLGIHVCACWIGAIVGRPQRPAPPEWGRWAVLNRPVPSWMGRAALVYALCVTLLSVGVQSLGLGHELADIAAASRVSRIDLLVLVLPHAVPELVAVFLPLGLFLREARRGRLERLGPWSLQAAAIALPLLMGAALIETYVTPPRVIAASRHAMAVASTRAPRMPANFTQTARPPVR